MHAAVHHSAGCASPPRSTTRSVPCSPGTHWHHWHYLHYLHYLHDRQYLKRTDFDSYRRTVYSLNLEKEVKD